MSDVKDQELSADESGSTQQTTKKVSALDSVKIVVESSSLEAGITTPPEEETVKAADSDQKPKEINGPKGLEPTRYGDWESKGRCYDF